MSDKANSVVFALKGDVISVSVAFDDFNNWLTVFASAYNEQMYIPLTEAVKIHLTKTSREAEINDCIEKMALVKIYIDGAKKQTKNKPVVDPELVFSSVFGGKND
jgi:hypothetical protein